MGEPLEPAQGRLDAYFRSEAPYWSEVYADGGVESAVYRERRDRAARTIERLDLPPGSPALEVGCGAGELAVRLARTGFAVTATDTVDAMLDRARRRAEDEQVALTVRSADVHALPFPDSSFELVVGLGVLPWLHSAEIALSEIVRVLRPGGYTVLTADGARRLNEVLDPWSTWLLAGARAWIRRRLDARVGVRRPLPYHRHRPHEVEKLLRAAGLEPVSGQAVGFGPFTLHRRPALPDAVGLRLNAALQARADRGSPLLRGCGVHYLAVARKPA